MPEPHPTWQAALNYLAGYHTSIPREEVVAGYWVPPARCILSPEDDEKKGKLIVGWLRLREVLAFQLTSSSCKPLQWTNKQWRTMLLVAGGTALSEDGNSAAANQRRVLREGLEKALEQSGIHVKLENLLERQASWKNIPVNELPDVDMVKEILWELNEICFRNDFRSLDNRLDRSGQNLMNRQDAIDQCWAGTPSYVELSPGSTGLGSSHWRDRLVYLKALHRVMRTWQPDKPEPLLEKFPDDVDSHNFLTTLERTESAMANFYAECFLDTFGRAASIPFKLR